MENQEKEITLGQLFGVFKKSLKRGLIYVLASVLIASLVLLAVKMFTNKTVYSTTIAFTEVEENMLPSLNSNKSNVINKALKENEKEIEKSNVILKDLSVSALEVAKIEDDEDFIPTSYVITLKKDKDLGFTSTEYKELLDSIATTYVNLYSQKSLQNIAFNFSENGIDTVEYIQSVDNLIEICDTTITTLKTNLQNFDELNDFFSDTTKKTINDTITELTVSNTVLKNLNTTIITNNIEKTEGGLKNYLEITKADFEKTYSSLDAQKTALLEAITNYTNMITAIEQNENGNNQYIFNDEGYMILANQYTAISGQSANAQAKITLYDNYITNLPASSSAMSTENLTQLKNTYSSIKKSMEDYNTLAKEYNVNQTKTSIAKQINATHSTSDGLISMKILILVDVAIALIAYVVAFSQTFTKMKENGYFD